MKKSLVATLKKIMNYFSHPLQCVELPEPDVEEVPGVVLVLAVVLVVAVVGDAAVAAAGHA